jgi:arylsulfatase A-like enzyme
MVVVTGVPKAVVHGGVEQLSVPHAIAAPGAGQQEPTVAHALLPTSYDVLGITEPYRLRRQDDSLEPRPTDLVDPQRAATDR